MLYNKIGTMNINIARQIILTDCIAIFSLGLLSMVSAQWLHVPPATHISQLLVIAGFSAACAASLHLTPHNEHRRQYRAELMMYSIMPALLAIGNYFLLYARHGVSAVYIDSQNSLHAQAMTLSLATLFGCQLFSYLVLSKKHSSNNNISIIAASLAIGGLIVYTPLLQSVFMTQGLDVMDILCALGAVAGFSLFRTLQSHTKAHTRHAVLSLHRENGVEL
jgi:hypothetical protein